MSIESKKEQIEALDKIIDSTILTVETRGILTDLFSICQRFDRSMDRERKFKAKKLGGGKNEVKASSMPPNMDTANYVEPEKKTNPALPVEELIEKVDVKEVEIEAKDPTDFQKILDFYTDGKQKAKDQFKNPKSFGKALRDIGVPSQGTDFDSHWKALEDKFTEISR